MNNDLYKDKSLLSIILNILTLTVILTVWSSGQATNGPDSAKKRVINVLSLEGGGTGGIIELAFLSEIEKEAEKQTGQKIPICELFDLIAGNSIGGMIAAGLALPTKDDPRKLRFTATKLLKEVEEQLPNFFQPRFSLWGLLGPKYKNIGPKQVTEHLFGNTTFDQPLTRVMISAFDLETNKTVIFKSWNPTRNCFYTNDIIRGTGSAPTYFEPHVMTSISRNGESKISYRLIDGEFSAGNPTQSAMIEAEKIFGRDQDFQILSLGAGYVLKSYPYKKYRDAGFIAWGFVLTDLFIDGQMSLTNYSMNHQYGAQYSHWSPPIDTENPAMDNHDPETLDYYKQATLEMIESRKDEFKSLVTRLLINRGLIKVHTPPESIL